MRYAKRGREALGQGKGKTKVGMNKQVPQRNKETELQRAE